MSTSTKKDSKTTSGVDFEHRLILHNDDYNEFDFVVDTLMDVCKHEYEQAYQCALITHHKGKCDVKEGSMEELRGMKHRILERGIGVTIE